MIKIDDFKKLNIVVGTIENVEEIEGSKKLLKFSVNIGVEIRQILGGFKNVYSPDELIGKQVLILENLEPRKMMGMESQGMILAATDSDGKPTLIQPVKPVANGSVVK